MGIVCIYPTEALGEFVNMFSMLNNHDEKHHTDAKNEINPVPNTLTGMLLLTLRSVQLHP